MRCATHGGNVSRCLIRHFMDAPIVFKDRHVYTFYREHEPPIGASSAILYYRTIAKPQWINRPCLNFLFFQTLVQVTALCIPYWQCAFGTLSSTWPWRSSLIRRRPDDPLTSSKPAFNVSRRKRWSRCIARRYNRYRALYWRIIKLSHLFETHVRSQSPFNPAVVTQGEQHAAAILN